MACWCVGGMEWDDLVVGCWLLPDDFPNQHAASLQLAKTCHNKQQLWLCSDFRRGSSISICQSIQTNQDFWSKAAEIVSQTFFFGRELISQWSVGGQYWLLRLVFTILGIISLVKNATFSKIETCQHRNNHTFPEEDRPLLIQPHL